VVRLQGAEGDHRVGAGFTGRAEVVLELAELVATGAERVHVVPLEQQVRQAEGFAEPRRFVQRRRPAAQVDAGDRGECGVGEPGEVERHRPSSLGF
jgi:hypothetical protein